MKYFLPLTLFLIFIISACSNASNPVENDNPENLNSNLDQWTIITNHTDISDSGDEFFYNLYRGVMGAWKVHLDPVNLTAEITLSRNAHAIGDTFDSDLSQFLTVSPCSNCLQIAGVDLKNFNQLHLEIRLKHPFGNINARPDLHGFDVRAIFVTPQSGLAYSAIEITKPDGFEEGAILEPFNILNADGYTSHYDWLVTDERYFIGGEDVEGNLNPFLRFFDSFSTDTFNPFNPAGYNVMPVGSNYQNRTAVFSSVPPDGLDFYIIADVAYGQSAVLANRQDPQYYLPEFNRTEPWRVEYWIENNNLTGADPSSSADVVVQVFDWQHSATVDPNFPDSSNPSGVKESSKVAQVELIVPSMTNFKLVNSTPESGSGTPTDPLQYRFTVQNDNQYDFGAYGLLAVRDELHGQTGRYPVPESPAGFPYETRDIRDYTLYVPIVINNPGSFENPYDGELFLNPSEQFTDFGATVLNPFFFMDQSGLKFQYRWDFDYDGETFDIDGSGNPSDTINISTPGRQDLALRIRTNAKPPREYLYEIPVYRSGEAFESTVFNSIDIRDRTSFTKNASVTMTNDNFYMVFENINSGIREVNLAKVNRMGNYEIFNITNGIDEDCIMPSICVVEDGPDQGVYIVFTIYGNNGNDLYSITGNLDGSGFSNSNLKAVSNDSDAEEYYATLIYREGVLYTYYYSYGNMGDYGDIRVAWSDDQADSWTVHPSVIGGSIPDDRTPSAAYSEFSDKVHVVWQSDIQYSDNGYDLNMASSSDMLNFGTRKNISSQPGNFNEYQPSISVYKNQIAIGYHGKSSGGDQRAYVKILNSSGSSMFDYKMKTGNSIPANWNVSVSTVSEDRVLVSYTGWDSGTLEVSMYTVDLDISGSISSVFENVLEEETVGTVQQDGAFFYPAIASKRVLDGAAAEHFVANTSYKDGSFVEFSIFAFTEFGRIDTRHYVTPGGYN